MSDSLIAHFDKLDELYKEGAITKKQYEILRVRLIQARLGGSENELVLSEFLTADKTITNVDLFGREEVTRLATAAPGRERDAPEFPADISRPKPNRRAGLSLVFVSLAGLVVILGGWPNQSARSQVRRIAAIYASLPGLIAPLFEASKVSPGSKDPSTVMFQELKRKIAAGDFEVARHLAGDLVSKEPENAEARTLLSVAEQSLFRNARNELTEGEVLEAMHRYDAAKAHWLKAKAMLHEGDLDYGKITEKLEKYK